LRIRIGVGKPPLAEVSDKAGREIRASGKDFLLSPMRKQELAELDLVLDRVRMAAEAILIKGPGPAMSEFNRTPPAE
jgi:PTH1 family peptidyl-tRNA hydrolase